MDELRKIQDRIKQFAVDRDWEKFHSPKNLVMALTGEVGELSECFQWLTLQESENLSAENRADVEDEIADIAIYLMRICQVMDVDLLKAISNKITKNELKYPIDKSKGRSNKYNNL